ncbi:MAG: ATP-dependent DNA helicase, partial [bacterium]
MPERVYPLAERLGGLLQGFEARPAQQSMAAAVALVLEGSGTLLVEAGTGTGKSLAYLLPAFERVRTTGGRVIVSTHTLNLQSQLLSKDIPLALAALGVDLAVVRAVGRGNYLCRLRLDTAEELARGDLFGGSHASLGALRDWAESGGGLREEAPGEISTELWEQTQVEAYGCLGRRCPRAEGCAFLRDREALREAQVVVVNHALLMADLAARREGSELLPEADTLVVDEAHHLADVAAEHLGLRLRRLGLSRSLDRLQDPRRRHGLLERLPSASLPGLLATCRAAVAEFFDAAAGLPADQALPPAGLEDPLSQPLISLAAELRNVAAALSEVPQSAGIMAETQALAARLDRAAGSLRAWLEQD